MRAGPILLVVVIGLLLPVAEARATVTTLPVPQLWQHKDNDFIPCIVHDPPWCPSGPPHAPACAPIPPWGQGCPHCAAYSAPTSIMAIRGYRGYAGCPCSQDCLYDKFKVTDGEIPYDFILQTHGVGLRDEEVFAAFTGALGEIYHFSNDPASPYRRMNEWVLRQLLTMGIPVVWIDRDGFPVAYMNQTAYQNMVARGEGHVKVIAGYDDLDTYCRLEDDRIMVIDPWPSAGSPYPDSPYWIPVGSALWSDSNDLFLSDDLGGIDIAATQSPQATAWSSSRRLARDGQDGSTNVVFASAGGIFFSRSREPHRPGSWSAPLRIDLDIAVHWSLEPALAVAPAITGTLSVLHAAWVESPAIGGPGDIHWSMSDDGGRTWSLPVLVHESPMQDSRRPSLDVDGLGIVHLAWDETGLLPGREVFYSKRAPGSPWTEPVNVSATMGSESEFASLATSYDYEEWAPAPGPSRRVHIAWVEGSLVAPATVVYRSWDPAAGWVPPLAAPPEDATGGRGGTSPSLIAGPDGVPRLVWTTSQEAPDAVPASMSDVLYNERTGGMWDVPRLVSPPDGPLGTASIGPALAFANGPFCSCLHATWEEWELERQQGDVWVALRHGMTLEWGSHIPVTAAGLPVRRFPALAYKMGVDFTKGYDLVWTEPSPHFDYVVRFLGTSRGLNAPSSVEPLPAPAASLALAARPNPFSGTVEFTAPPAAAGWALEIYDARGRLVRELARSAAARWTWDGRSALGQPLPQGVYFARIAGGGVPARRVVLLK